MIFYCQKTHQSNEGNKSSVKKYQHRGLGGDWAAVFFLFMNSSVRLPGPVRADILGHTSTRLLPDNYSAINNSVGTVTVNINKLSSSHQMLAASGELTVFPIRQKKISS